MERINSLKITAITVSGFRSYKDETTFKSGDLTFISGDNGKGKSSIAHTITYAFYGVNAYGLQDIDRIRNKKSNTVSVKLEFIDAQGKTHTLSRKRTNDKTELVFNNNIITQTDITRMLGDKDTFLSLFNPAYFVEIMGGKAKEFLEFRLPIIKSKQVFPKLTPHECERLNGIDLVVPEAAIKNLRTEIRQMEDDSVFINGQLSELKKSESEKASKITELQSKSKQLCETIDSLKAKQFSGINVNDLNMEKCMLDDKLSNSQKQNDTEGLGFLNGAMFEVESREYRSKYTQTMNEISTGLEVMSVNYNGLKTRLSEIVIGNKCPTCLTEVTADNIDSIKSELQNQMGQVMANGRTERAKLNELVDLDKKAKEKFDEFQANDIAKIKLKIAELKQQNPDNQSEVYRRINEINETLTLGNLSKDEFNELKIAECKLQKVVDSLNVLQNTDYVKRITKLNQRISEIDALKEKSKEIISAIQEYVAKRAELALAGLKTSNVTIQLYEIIKTTGELKPCFKFLYDGLEYPTLSLSEKTKAGLEITAMLRELLGLDYPVFIDNSESIGSYTGIELPQQTFIMKFVKDAPLKVVYRNNQAKISEVKSVAEAA